MQSITFRHKGDFSKITRFLSKAEKPINTNLLNKYGRMGVNALKSATPVDTGLTASSWYYKIVQRDGSVSLEFYNSNRQNGVLIAVILQYGHATGTGGWVEGVDYINPALKPIFDELAKEAWKEVVNVE